MTSTKLVSVKIPERVWRLMPPAGQGRSQFIIEALEEKISQQRPAEWKPATKRGRRLAALLKRGRQERLPPLDSKAIAAELAERKGRFH